MFSRYIRKYVSDFFLHFLVLHNLLHQLGHQFVIAFLLFILLLDIFYVERLTAVLAESECFLVEFHAPRTFYEVFIITVLQLSIDPEQGTF